MDLRRLYDTDPFTVRQGRGFSVRFFSPDGLRYTDGARELTLITEFLDKTRERGRRFVFFPKYVKTVYIPSTLSWDDGTPITADAAEEVLARIGAVLAETFREYEIVRNDQAYEQLHKVVLKNREPG